MTHSSNQNNKRENLISEASSGSSFAQTNKGQLEYTDIGNGSPILHLHGTPGGCDNGPQIFHDFITSGFRIITPSRPGYLNTSLSVGKTPNEQAEAFISLLDHLNISKVALFAWSGGGPSALSLAMHYPERVSCLIMCAAVSHKHMEKNLHLKNLLLNDFIHSLILISHDFKLISLEELVCEELGVNHSQVLTDENKLTRLKKIINSTMPSSDRKDGFINDVEQYSVLPEYPVDKINCPVLVIHNDKDDTVPISHANNVSNKLDKQKVEYLNYSDGGHAPMLGNDWDNIIETTSGFIKRAA